MSALLETPPRPLPTAATLARCLACSTRLEGRSECPSCRRAYPVDDGILRAIGPLSGTNRVAAAFYDGPSWPRFRFWEQVFLWCQGPGPSSARRQVLRHLPDRAEARVLEVGIGDGENLPLLPTGWEVFGVDIALGRLRACRDRFPGTSGRLAWAEGERLPFDDQSFDAVFSVGGFNYFRDPAAALREMRRVARPGAVLVAADEIPDLYRFGLGHVLGLEAIDRLWLRLVGLDREFVAMVFETPPRVEAAARAVWPGHRRVPIWNRLGYCLVDTREL
jgi:SAM-dependent methyltransferase